MCVCIVKKKDVHATHTHNGSVTEPFLQVCSPLIATLLNHRQADSPCLFICSPINLQLLLLLTAPQSRPVSIPSTPDLAHLNASGRTKTAEKRERDLLKLVMSADMALDLKRHHGKLSQNQKTLCLGLIPAQCVEPLTWILLAAWLESLRGQCLQRRRGGLSCCPVVIVHHSDYYLT